MKAAVIVFPGSNCDRDLAEALRRAGATVQMVWHKDTVLPQGLDLVGIPGGFSFGDYLRCGAIAAQSPICKAVAAHVERGGFALGICNGFQVLTETGLLPGATSDSAFTRGYSAGQTLDIPVAHHDGNYVADAALVERLRDQDRVAFRYGDNPNGSTDDIAGILSENRRVLGMMPHPERAAEQAHGGTDGAALFAGLTEALALA